MVPRLAEGHDVDLLAFFLAPEQLAVPESGELVIKVTLGETELGEYVIAGDLAAVLHKGINGLLERGQSLHAGQTGGFPGAGGGIDRPRIAGAGRGHVFDAGLGACL